jgi:hypothetical protein
LRPIISKSFQQRFFELIIAGPTIFVRYLSKDKPMLKEETKAIQTKSMATTCYYNPDLAVMNSGHFKKYFAVLEYAFHQ